MAIRRLRYFFSLCMALLLVGGSMGSSFVIAEENGTIPDNNLISNPGFEQPLQDGEIPGWRINGGEAEPGTLAEVTDSLNYSGTHSLYIEDTTPEHAIVVHTDAIEIEEGRTYELTLQANQTAGTVYAGIRYYATETAPVINGYIGSEFVKLSPTQEWSKVQLEARAPAEANYARILLYTTRATTGQMYIDDVQFELQEGAYPEINYELENLGSQVHTLNTHRAAFGEDASGNLLAYSTMVGLPAKLLVIDVKNDKLIDQIPIEATVEGKTYSMTYVRGLAVQDDGTVYLAGTPSYMFKYVPGDDQVQYITSLPGSQLFDMVNGPDGILIGGTYNRSEAFEFDTSTEQTRSLGRIMDDETYAYSVAYDKARDVTYFGIGSHGHLIRYDRKTGEKTNIPLPVSPNFVFDLTVSGDKLFMRFSPGNAIAMDLETLEFDETDQYITSRLVSQPSPVDNKVYFTTRSKLGYYDMDKQEYHSLDLYTDGDAYAYKFVELNEPDFPGYTLVGITRYARVFKYNLETGHFQYEKLDLHGEPTQLQTVKVGEDGKVHTSGYLSGGNAIYDPVAGNTTEYTDITLTMGQQLNQTDRIYTYQGKVYYATYPNMNVYEFDPERPWERSGSEPNPRLLFTAYDVGEQDRGTSGTMIEEEGILVIGTVPKYGRNGGALVLYNLETDEREVYLNVIDQQSISAIAHKEGLIYGGSSIWGGLGQEPTASEAKLFIWDVEKQEKLFEIVPIPGKTAITEIIVGPDGNIWGSAEGELFIFDPETREVIHTQQLVNRSYNSAVWRDAQFEVGKDGNVYGVQAGKFFVIDADTKQMRIIRDEGIRNWLSRDEYGRFYLTEGTDLLRITIPEATVEPVTVDSLSEDLDRYILSGDIHNAMASQLTNKLQQVRHHSSNGRSDQAIKFLEDFIRHLNNESLSDQISSEAQQDLNTKASQLMNTMKE